MFREWEEAYEAAVLELDQVQLPERIRVATTVLQESLQRLGESPQDSHERQWIEDAMRTLEMLRRTELSRTDG